MVPSPSSTVSALALLGASALTSGARAQSAAPASNPDNVVAPVSVPGAKPHHNYGPAKLNYIMPEVSGAQITVTKTQPLPGVGPTDNGSFLAALATHQEPPQPTQPWWPMALSYGGLAAAVWLIAWLMERRKRSADLTSSP